MDAYEYVPLSYLIITQCFLTLVNRKGLTDVKAEYAVQKYKSHCHIKESLHDL